MTTVKLLVAVDGGTSAVKTAIQHAQLTHVQPHLLVELSEHDAHNYVIESRGKVPHGLLTLDGRFFAYGDYANTKRPMARSPRGAARYTDMDGSYMPYLFSAAIAAHCQALWTHGNKTIAHIAEGLARRLRNADTIEIVLITVIPPLDKTFTRNMRQSFMQWQGANRTVSVGMWIGSDYIVKELVYKHMSIISEPEGGFYTWYYTIDGVKARQKAEQRVKIGKTLVIDGGARTIDFMSFDTEGKVGIHASVPVGINDVLDALLPMLHNKFADVLNGQQLSMQTLRQALVPEQTRNGRTNSIMLRGKTYDITEEVAIAMSHLMREYKLAYDQIAGGGVEVATIVLTGGGHILLQPYLADLLLHQNVDFATSVSDLQFANVQGCAVWANRLRAMRVLDQALLWDAIMA